MDEIPNYYDFENLAQLRAIADPLRSRVFDSLTMGAKTATQVAEELGETAQKIHYHVRELERVGLVRQVDTREVKGILEKYFRAVARNVRVPASLFRQAPPDEMGAMLQDLFNDITMGFQAALQRFRADNFAHIGEEPLTLGQETIWITGEEYVRALEAALELFRPYRVRRGVEGERETTLTIIGYQSSTKPETDRDAANNGANATQAPMAAASLLAEPAFTPKDEQGIGETRKVVVVGIVIYSRRELEDLAARGKKLDLTVIGQLTFADDVTADLIERTVERVKLFGVMSASPTTRAALRKKEV